jgi:hypothetical protein
VARKQSPSASDLDAELERLREHLSELPWDDLYPRLLLAALGKIGRIPWKGQVLHRKGQVALANDAIQTAFEKFWSGVRRHWDWSKSDFRNLWGAVSGEIINWGTSAENTRTSRILSDDENVVQSPSREPGSDRRTEWLLMHEQLLQFLGAEDGKLAQMAKIMLDKTIFCPSGPTPSLSSLPGSEAARETARP